MARAIDAGAVKRRAWDIAEAWKDQGRDYEALLLESVVEQIVDTQPTLTPPNEPLTLEELREMEQSTPVWWDYIPCWVLVRRGSVLVFGSEPHKVEKLFGYFYRRPPEGEEEP